jgi:hypothetical protein
MQRYLGLIPDVYCFLIREYKKIFFLRQKEILQFRNSSKYKMYSKIFNSSNSEISRKEKVYKYLLKILIDP